MTEKRKTLLVFDANSLAHRSWHALPPLQTPKGESVNAVYGFFSVFFKVVQEFQPEYIAAAFDLPGPTERHEKFKEYKAQREKKPDELYAQISRIRETLERIGVRTLAHEGYEADDCIGTIAAKARREGLGVIIVSGDQDAFQLIDEQTKVYTMRKGIQDTIIYGTETVAERFGGLHPEQLVDFKALRGDPSDNIPGVPGIGEKTALQLIREFGSLEGVYEALEKGADAGIVKPKTAALLKEHKDIALLSKELVTINRSAPADFDKTAMEWKGANRKEVRDTLESFGFQSLMKRVSGNREKKGGSGQLQFEGEAAQKSVSEERHEKIEQLREQEVLSERLCEIETKLVPVIGKMEEVGIQIDTSRFQALEQEAAEDLEKLTKEIYRLTGSEFNINSPQQLSKMLFEDLGISPKGLKKTPGRVVSTAASELEKLRGEHAVVERLLEYRELQKMYTTYIHALPRLVDENSRIHTTFGQLGTATGRLTSSSPNLQNIPVRGDWGRKIREGFVAPPGWSFAALDYSQIELRVVAHIAKDAKMQEFFWQKADIHRMTAAEVFGIAPEKVTDEMRYRAKALNFGVLYGMGPAGFAKSADIPHEQAQEFIDSYFIRFPGIFAYIERTKEFAREHGYTETLFGRRRYIPEIHSSTPQFRAAAEREAVNHPIQGTAADLIKIAMVRLHEELLGEWKDAKMLLQIHDELLFEIRDDIVGKTVRSAQQIMETAHALDVPLLVEGKTGGSWGGLRAHAENNL